MTRADTEALGELARAHDLFVIADDSYDRLVYDGHRHESMAALPNESERTILIKSCTKSYAMPAWRVGYIVAAASLIDPFTKVLEWELLHANHVAQAAAAAAIEGPQDWLEDVPIEFETARDQLIAGLVETEGFSCVPPRGGPFLFLNIEQLFTSSDAASDALLAVGLPTVPGRYCQSDAHVRMAFGARPGVLDQVLIRMAEVARTVADRTSGRHL